MKKLLLFAIGMVVFANSFSQKITLTNSMLSYYNGQGNSQISLSPLVDEQSSVTGALTDNSYTPHPSTLYIPSWGANPVIQVNLGGTYTLSQIGIYDSWNAAGLTVKYDNAGTWVNLFTWDMSYNEKWRAVTVSATTTKLLFEFAGLNAQIGEIAVFGSGSAGDTQAPTVPANLASSSITYTGVTLNWSASTDNVGVTGYEVYKNGTLLTTVTVTSASVTGLTASTAYTFKVRAKDAANNFSAYTSDLSVTTSAPAGDTQAPTVPANLASSAITSTGVTLNWSASTDNVGVTGYEVYKNGTLLTTVTGTTTTVSGLSPSTTYVFKVRAKDAANNFSAYTSDLSVTTSAPAGDTQAPTVPANLASSAITSTGVTLNWSASTDNVGVTGYEVYKNGTLLSTITVTSASVTGLTASTAYTFKVRAKDAANNYSAYTSDLSVTTSAPAGDTQSPTVPTGLVTSNVSSSDLNLSWNASTDNVGVTGYEIYRNGSLQSTVSTTSTTVTGLSPATTYTFKVRAKDAAGNFSAFTADVSATTQSGGACVPSKLTLTTSMISGAGNPSALLDEQTVAGDPSQGTGGAPSTNWFAGWDAAGYPASATLNFGSSTTITAIYLRDINDAGAFTVEIGTPGNWNPIFVDNLTGYMSWNQHAVNVTTQYLRFTMGSYSANVAEVVIFGCIGPVIPDTTTPAAITTLAAGNASSTAVQLSWTATGDDGNTGSATSYDVRYSTSPITTDTQFNSATQATGEPNPLFAGNPQSFFVSGLTPSTTYYFAMKVADEANNISPLSNSVSKATGAVGTSSAITVDQFIGINAFNDDPVNKMQVAGFVREYHNWAWDEGDIWSGGGNWAYPVYPNNQMKFAPSEAGGGGWNFDTFYTNVLAGGLTISPAIQGAPAWLQGGTGFAFDDKPLDESGASSTDPNSYEKKANHMYQYAARYGSTHVADAKLQLAAGQPRNSGMGLIKYIEDYNEQDKDWKGAAAHFSAQEYAAMASADYDGHGNTMHQGTGNFGIKNADPNMKFVMGGIYQLNLQYIMDMKTWFEANRADHKFVPDVINVHDYAFSGGGPGASPEEHQFKEKLLPFTQYRDANLPGKEVWISEFGWDTNQSSVLRAPVIGPFDQFEVQAQWIVRAYLAFAAAHVDRAMMYMLRDVNPGDATQFSTSGLVAQKNDWTPKPSWYYVYTMKNTLTNMVFLGEQASTDPNILIYKFKNTTSSEGAYVVWAKTKQNYTVSNYTLNLTGTATSATRVDMVNGDTDGVNSTLAISGGHVSVNVSERPVFIKVNNIQ